MGEAFEALNKARYASLTTVRSNGTPVSTPVWVAVSDQRAYVVSRGPGKVRRIGHNPAVEICPSDMRGRARGEIEPGLARIIGGDPPGPEVRRAFRRKYGPFPALTRIGARLLRRDLVLLEISPRD